MDSVNMGSIIKVPTPYETLSGGFYKSTTIFSEKMLTTEIIAMAYIIL